MKTRVTLVLALALVMVLGGTLAVGAQGGTWVSGVMIQNQSDSEVANIVIRFYWAEGEALAGQMALQFEDTIPAGQAKTYYIPAHIAGLPDDFVGSAVVSSDQPIAANLNTQRPTGAGYGDTSANPDRVGTASGVLDPASMQYFPQVMKDYYGWNSYFAVQNTSADTATVTVEYYKGSDGTKMAGADQTVSIHAYTTYIFRQSDNANLPAMFSGSAVVESDGGQALAGIANFYNAGTAADTAQFQSYNAFAGGATKLWVPRVVRTYYDYNSGLAIQNVGAAATDITIVFTFGGTDYTKTITGVQPNQSIALYLPSTTQVPELTGVDQATGSAVISSSGQSIVATINEDNRVLGQGITYNAVPDGDQTNTVLFPQVTAKYYGYSGGTQVMNTSETTAATATAVFSMAGRTDITVGPVSIPAKGSWSIFAPGVTGMAADFNGSVVITADQNLVGIANMSYRSDIDPRYGNKYGDTFTTYNGIAR